MEDKKLSERLRFDVKFLLWRAEVYALSAEAIDQRFQAIRDEYLQLAGTHHRSVIESQLQQWEKAIQDIRLAASA